MTDKIKIPGKTLKHLQPGQQAVIRVWPQVYNMLVDLSNESILPLKNVASEIIKQAIEKDLVELERKVVDEEDGNS